MVTHSLGVNDLAGGREHHESDLSVTSSCYHHLVISVRHELGLKDIGHMASVILPYSSPSRPVPQNQVEIVTAGRQKLPTEGEVYAVDTALVTL